MFCVVNTCMRMLSYMELRTLLLYTEETNYLKHLLITIDKVYNGFL